MAEDSNFRAILSSRAEIEIAESWDWYEDRQYGLGDRFLKEVTNRIRDINKCPINILAVSNRLRKSQFTYFLL